MKVFISWSGMNSKKIAFYLKRTLEAIFENEDFETFMSDEDILSGSEWFTAIKDELQDSNCAILCLTRENIGSPWINFEAGAIGMQHGSQQVIPLLIDTDIPTASPLRNYQAVTLNQEGFKRMLKTIRRMGALYNLTDRQINAMANETYRSFSKDINDILKKISEEYPLNHITTYPSHIYLLKKNSVFIGAPMASLKEDEYIALREHILPIKEAIEKSCGIRNVHYPGTQISDSSVYDGEEKAILENYKVMKESEFLLFIYPEKITSSVLTEIGYGIALSKKIIIFTHSRNALPYMLRESDKVISNLKIYTYERYGDIIHKIETNGPAFFSLR